VISNRSTIEKSRAARKRLNDRERMRKLRERARLHQRDPISYFLVPLPQSVVDQLVAELKIKWSDDAPISDREWRKMVGLVIAEAVKRVTSRKL
jgi:hypothetical protein